MSCVVAPPEDGRRGGPWPTHNCTGDGMSDRAEMLARRAAAQVARSPGFTPMLRKPRGHVGKWDPAGDWMPLRRDKLVPAWMNRRTGKPHERTREKSFRGRVA